MPKKSKQWPFNFGTITSLHRKSGPNGPYALVTMQCGKHVREVIAFGAQRVEKLVQAGEGATVWLKGPIHQVLNLNQPDSGHKIKQMKAIYIKVSNKKEATKRQPEKPPKPVVQDLTQIKGIGKAIAKMLNTGDIINYQQLLNASNPALEEIQPGFAKRAEKWRPLAAELINAALEEQRQAQSDKENAFA